MQALLRITLPLALLILTGCASAPAKRDPRDPWERLNRSTSAFNDGLDRAIAKPVARGYQKVTPGFMRTGISNFFDNLNATTTIVNDVLQLHVKDFFSDSGRFVMNSTLGIAGFLDPASAAGLQRHTADFGQTLGKWGFHPGPYLVIPVLGPSDIRDAVGRVGDHYSVVAPYVLNTWPSVGLGIAEAVDTRYRLLPTERLLEQSYDRYAFIRNAYLQRREFLIHGNKPSTDEDENEKLLEELDKEDKADKQAPPPPPK
jgi:phospholipid-binding lipoprotein MlaA